MTSRLFSLILLPCFCLAGGSLLPSRALAEYEKTDQGVLIKIADAQVEVSSSAHGIFHIGVAFGAKPKAPSSIFLAEGATTEPWQVVTQGEQVGIKTETGQLLVDQKAGTWVLTGPDGKAVVQGTSVSSQQDAGAEAIKVGMVIPKGPPFHAYGSGNGDPGKRQLLQGEGNSRLGNGVSVIPYYWSTAGYGVFAVSDNDNTPAKWSADTTANLVTWTFPGKSADLYLFPAKDLYQAARDYATLTGHAPVPPKWSFGYLQSRWGWESKAYIDDVLKNFHDRNLPVDAFILDFECYTATPDYSLPDVGAPNFPDFGWNAALLPNPAANIAAYRAQGLRIIPIRKPRMGDQATLAMMHEKGWILTNGGNGEVGALMNQRDVDFGNPEVRTWYAERLRPMAKDGVAGWWNDEGESSYTKYFYWNVAEIESVRKIDPNFRHWSLNRSFQPGLQRLGAAAWTGDIGTKWASFGDTPGCLLNWGLAGMPYSTCDIGGYKSPVDSATNKRPPATPELMARWMEAGVFFPFMRAHSAHKMLPHFPWLYGPEAEAAIQKALNLRYRLIPYYYSLAHETYATGAPLMRPLVMEFPNDPAVENLSTQWLMGAGLMAAPLLSEGGNRSVYFPDDMTAFDGTKTFKRGETLKIQAAPLDTIPVYVRKGTILPLGPVVQNTTQLPGGPLEVRIYPGRDASFTLSEDDGLSYDYQKGRKRQTRFIWNEAQRTLSWTQEGDYAGKDVFTRIKVVVFDPAGKKEAPEADLGPSGSIAL